MATASALGKSTADNRVRINEKICSSFSSGNAFLENEKVTDLLYQAFEEKLSRWEIAIPQ